MLLGRKVSDGSLFPTFQSQLSSDKHADVFSFNSPFQKDTLRAAIVAIVWQDKKEQDQKQQDKKEPGPDIASCPTCHQTYQPQGTSDEEYATNPPKDFRRRFLAQEKYFKTIPNSHTTCFSCQ